MAQKIISLCENLECPICLDYLQIPIKQCVIGHSFCAKCVNPNNIKKCPECRSDILDTRNYKLEEVIENMPFPCVNKKTGCPYMLSQNFMGEHILECKHRKFNCEGRQFCDWKCDWEGYNILEHFKSKHIGHTSMEFNTKVMVLYNSATQFVDVQIISAHYELFWYKHKIDLEKKRALWAIQYIGPRKQAHHYYYEFEIFNEAESIRKLKVTEYCQSDIEDINMIFESEKCVSISFIALKSYIDANNEYSFRFRIMKLKKDKEPFKATAIASKVKTKKKDQLPKKPSTEQSWPFSL